MRLYYSVMSESSISTWSRPTVAALIWLNYLATVMNKSNSTRETTDLQIHHPNKTSNTLLCSLFSFSFRFFSFCLWLICCFLVLKLCVRKRNWSKRKRLVVYTPTGWCGAQWKSRVNEAAALTASFCEIINAVIFYKKQFPDWTRHYLNPPARQQLKEGDL